MSTGPLSLSLQEAIARDRIVERVSAAHHSHHAPKPAGRLRRHVRAAHLLRSLAERLDPPVPSPTATAAPHPATAPHACSPRPWTAAPRRAPHRHS